MATPTPVCTTDMDNPACFRAEQTASGWVFADNHGVPFTQLWQHVPALAPLYSTFENTFNAYAYSIYARDNFHVALALVTAYAVAVFLGPKLLANVGPFEAKRSLAAWNLLLSVFSFCGMVRTVPHLLWNWYQHGYKYTMCEPASSAYGMGAAGFWTMLFVFSKVPELFDTFFLLIRKRPVIFLHWYHHITVLLYAWYSYGERSAAGLWFIAMNYTVHSVMYFYYFLAAINVRVRWGLLVTILQISQMFVGVMVCIAVYYFQAVDTSAPCHVSPAGYTAGLIMYGSYLVLFVLFAINRYCTHKPVRKPDPKAVAATDANAAAVAAADDDDKGTKTPSMAAGPTPVPSSPAREDKTAAPLSPPLSAQWGGEGALEEQPIPAPGSASNPVRRRGKANN